MIQTAVGILSRRDHSKAELKQKLHQRGFSVSEIEESVAQCDEWGYLDDGRFAMGYARSRALSGQGPQKIRQELKLKRVAPHLIEAALNQSELDWWQLCGDLAERRAHKFDLCDYAGRQKAFRFLMGRGFESDQIREALSALQQD